MGKLHDAFIKKMQVRQLSERTIEAYDSHVLGYVRHIGKSPALTGDEEIVSYLHYLLHEKKAGASSIRQAYSGLKFFFVHVLDREWPHKLIPVPKVPKKLPLVLSFAEIGKLFAHVANLKYRTALMTCYSGGLRLGETLHLQLDDILSDRQQIRVRQGKGKRDRYTVLSARLLRQLRVYYREYRPGPLLFPGKSFTVPLHASSVQRAFQIAKKKPA